MYSLFKSLYYYAYRNEDTSLLEVCIMNRKEEDEKTIYKVEISTCIRKKFLSGKKSRNENNCDSNVEFLLSTFDFCTRIRYGHTCTHKKYSDRTIDKIEQRT